MAITAAQVKELREMTGAGMMDCKKALTATDGDMDKAVEFLREKRSCYSTEESKPYRSRGSFAKLWLQRMERKQSLLRLMLRQTSLQRTRSSRAMLQMLQHRHLTQQQLISMLSFAEAWALDTTKTVKEALAAQIAVIGENMNIRRFAQVEEQNGFIASYTHMGGKIGVLVDVETDVVNDAVKEMAKNVAMQIAALKPQYKRQGSKR